MNSKGSINDLFYILGMILISVVVLLVMVTVWGELTTSDPWIENFNTAEINATVTGVNTAYSNFDNAIVVAYVLLNLTAIISAALIRTHPLFFIVSMLLMVFLIMLSAIFGNIYYAIASNSIIAPWVSNYTLIYNLFLYLPVLSMVWGMLLAVIMYGKTSGGSVSGY